MESHRYTVSWRGILSHVLVPVLGVFFWAALIRTLGALNFLPEPRPVADLDQTLFRYKREASQSKTHADMILIGDSSCMTGVDSVQLAALLPERLRVLNLSLVVGLSLATLVSPAAIFAETNPGQVRWIVLLVTPLKLTMAGASDHHEELWKGISSNQRIAQEPHTVFESAAEMLGLTFARDRIASYVLRKPMEGTGAGFYAFAQALSDYLREHCGSFVDAGVYVRPPGKQQVDYFLSPSLETSSRRVRAMLPPGAKLAVGITPAPEGHVDLSHVSKHRELLMKWNEWLRADVVLTNLPARLPDGLFASRTHLNGAGQKFFTRRLAEELRRSGFIDRK